MKKLAVAAFLVLFLVGCSSLSYINRGDNIPDGDERIIKEFRSHHDYSDVELKNLSIVYLGEIDGYRIYEVPYKGEGASGEAWIRDGYKFPFKSHARIMGIKNGHLYTLGELIYETSIDAKGLYNLMPEEYKTEN